MAKEICENCGKVFEAGPRQFLCPDCLKERQRQGGRNSAKKRREKRKGASEDK